LFWILSKQNLSWKPNPFVRFAQYWLLPFRKLTLKPHRYKHQPIWVISNSWNWYCNAAGFCINQYGHSDFGKLIWALAKYCHIHLKSLTLWCHSLERLQNVVISISKDLTL
jgi:hypothetical protein